jgi:catechol 2,3-dioxygenase-like lactoylglutathione lyase family enzyme
LIARAGDTARAATGSFGMGMEHVAFTVTGIEAAVEEAMRAKGVTIQNGPARVRPGVRIAFLGPAGRADRAAGARRPA